MILTCTSTVTRLSIFYKNVCKTSLAESKPCGLLKQQSAFHKHVSYFLRMMRPVVSVVVHIQVRSAFMWSVTELNTMTWRCNESKRQNCLSWIDTFLCLSYLFIFCFISQMSCLNVDLLCGNGSTWAPTFHLNYLNYFFTVCSESDVMMKDAFLWLFKNDL